MTKSEWILSGNRLFNRFKQNTSAGYDTALLTMNIPRFDLLKQNIVGIEEVLSAPPHMAVKIKDDRGGTLPAITAGQLRTVLEGSVYNKDYGWELLFPGEEKDPQGCYQGFSGCSYYWASIEELDYSI